MEWSLNVYVHCQVKLRLWPPPPQPAPLFGSRAFAGIFRIAGENCQLLSRAAPAPNKKWPPQIFAAIVPLRKARRKRREEPMRKGIANGLRKMSDRLLEYTTTETRKVQHAYTKYRFSQNIFNSAEQGSAF